MSIKEIKVKAFDNERKQMCEVLSIVTSTIYHGGKELIGAVTWDAGRWVLQCVSNNSFCWGGFKIIRETGRDKELIEMFPNAKCFGKNKNGMPFHPLAMMPRNGRDPNKPELFLYQA